MDPKIRFIPKLDLFPFPLELERQNQRIKQCLETGETFNQSNIRYQDAENNKESNSPGIIDRIRDTFTGGVSSFFNNNDEIESNYGINLDLPEITSQNLERYEKFIQMCTIQEVGVLKGSEAVNIFSQSKLEKKNLSVIWNLVDRGQKG